MTKKKTFTIGFLIGSLGALVATFGLVSGVVETLGKPFLAPTKFVLSALSYSRSNFWIFLITGGLIYALIFLAISYLAPRK